MFKTLEKDMFPFILAYQNLKGMPFDYIYGFDMLQQRKTCLNFNDFNN